MPKVLFIAPSNLSAGSVKVAQNCLRNAGIKILDVTFTNIAPNSLRKRTKTLYEAVPEKEPVFIKKLTMLQPDFIVINDKAALSYITGGKYTSLALCRGSIYVYNLGGRLIPCLVIDTIGKTRFVKTAMWILVNDIKKLKRWITGDIRNEPKFNYTVCKTKNLIDEFNLFASNSIAIALDIETSVGHISCIGYTCVNISGVVHTYVVPFIDGSASDGCFWKEEADEVYAWEVIKIVNANKSYKIMQNGSYDAAWLLRTRMPIHNYICDTMHGFHSIWCELPKRLDFCASIAMDTYTYWKDEGKEDAKEDTNKTRIPKSVSGMENYWRYNALDCHSTFGVWRFIMAHFNVPKLKWAMNNYSNEFQQQFGPAFAMTMRGCNYNPKLLKSMANEMQTGSDKARKELQLAFGEDFNPNSPIQVKEIIYEVFKVKPYKKKGQTTDEKVLKMVYAQNPMAAWFMDTLWACKKPANNISKYASNINYKGRCAYKLGAGITDTGRYSSRGHDFWCGINIQNMPEDMRVMLEPDAGCILYDIDYAQSDSYFVAFDLQDKQFMENVLSDKDTHCLHTSFFFGRNYDEIALAHKNHEPWTSHKLTGVRSISKKISHGANYLMGGGTLFITMERERVIAAAIARGYPDAMNWSDNKLIKLCDAFIASYFKMYPEILPALGRKADAAIANGNIASCYGGRTRMFFGDLNDESIQRVFASFFGQGGTAENINKSLHNLYWSDFGRELEKAGHRILLQVHDSLVGQVPATAEGIQMVEAIRLSMENECELHGRKFIVPCAAQVGLGWGKRMQDYNTNLTIEQVNSFDNTWWEKRNERR